MRMWSHAVRRPLLPAVIGLAALVACEAPTVPERGLAAKPTTNTAVVAGSSMPGLKPIQFTNREDFAPEGGWTSPAHTINCGIGQFPKTYVGSGTTTHLGSDKSFAEWMSCGPEAGYILVARGVGQLIGARGDTISGTFVQRFVGALTAQSSTFTIEMTFTGGTGRYEGVQGVALGWGTRVGTVSSWQLSGTLFTNTNK